ncbi:mRNA interferase MazF [Kineothrix alysoides]|uniref:mRNA interferase n=1 Tax=Kineothrix alysoides TaxID=1469948 RepID=A0A4R1R533_9FIRM|nr:type II toxin-antitoxin system PemK/MazF family toxin [Kineothrix alysoides]TCL60558.1 mRNA interferase MazF [Kineothrix alysoides]
MCRRGEIYNIDFGYSADSHKQSGIRPVVIVSNNKANINAPVVTIVPLTARVWKKKNLPTHVQIPSDRETGLVKPSMALAEQVETLDKNRLGEKVGEIRDADVMNRLTIALQIQIGAYEEYN